MTAIQQANHRSFLLSILLGRNATCGHEKDYGFQAGTRAFCPWREVGNRCKQPTSELHTRYKLEVLEIRDTIVRWPGVLWEHQLNGFRRFDLMLGILGHLGVAGASLGVTVSFGTDFVVLAFCLLLATFAYLGASVTVSSGLNAEVALNTQDF